MYSNKTIQIADTIHGSIKLSEMEKQVISEQIFNRLHNISQNSTVFLTFPTNRTKRFEHSIGTMLLCGNIFYNSVLNADQQTIESFFSEVEYIISKEIDNILNNQADKYRSAIGDRNLSKQRINEYRNFEIGTSYTCFIPINLPEKYRCLYTVLFQAVRLSALLHDVGHPPFSHITEYAFHNIWDKVNKIEEDKRTDRQKDYIKTMEKYFHSKHDLHEQIGNLITDKVMGSIIGNISDSNQRNITICKLQLFKIFVKEITSAILQEKTSIFADIHRIIDGALDGDRLDYVSRDPINSGLDIGKIEYDRLICTMRLVKLDNNFLFSPSTKVIDTIEDFFTRRWKLYKQIIYHHRVIKTDYLLQSCIEELSLQYLSQKEEDASDNKGNILPYNISGLWKAIENKASRQDFFDSLIQWDDGWLMTILKKHYFLDYSNKFNSNTFYKLEELLANKKNYYSVIKRMEDFIGLDNSVAKTLGAEYNNINSKIDEIKKTSSKTKEDENEVFKLSIDPFLNDVQKIWNTINMYIKSKSHIPIDGFILAKIKNKNGNFFNENWLDKIIEDAVNEVLHSKKEIKDHIIVFKNVKTGVQEGLALYNLYNEKLNIKRFNDLSKEGKSLLYDKDFFPTFYLYVLKDDNYLDYNKLKSEIGECIGQKIIYVINEKLKSLL